MPTPRSSNGSSSGSGGGRWRLAANTTDSPVLIDDAGHALGGHEYGPVDTGQAAVTTAVERGVLVYPDLPARGASGPAAAAQKRVDHLNQQDTSSSPSGTNHDTEETR